CLTTQECAQPIRRNDQRIDPTLRARGNECRSTRQLCLLSQKRPGAVRNDKLALAGWCVSGDINGPGQNDRQTLKRFACFGQHLARTVRLRSTEASYPLNLSRFQDRKDLVAPRF